MLYNIIFYNMFTIDSVLDIVIHSFFNKFIICFSNFFDHFFRKFLSPFLQDFKTYFPWASHHRNFGSFVQILGCCKVDLACYSPTRCTKTSPKNCTENSIFNKFPGRYFLIIHNNLLNIVGSWRQGTICDPRNGSNRNLITKCQSTTSTCQGCWQCCRNSSNTGRGSCWAPP